MTDILSILDDELDRTPHDAYMCRPLRRSVMAAAAAEIRRLRVQHQRDQRMIDDVALAQLTTADSQE